MEKNKVRGEKRSTVNETVMQTALQEILQGRLRIKDASSAFGIPKPTLYARLQRVKKELPESQTVSLMMGLKKKEMVNKFASQQILSIPEEKNFVAYLLASSKLNFGLTLPTTRELAYKYAVSIGRNVPASWEINKKAGKKWARLFLKRHREISLRKPEATSLARNSGFTRENVEMFFNNLQEIMEQHHFEPSRIFNLDETGLSTVLQPPKVVADTKSKQVGKCVTAERGETITICAFVNAAGETFPPVYLFPRKRNHPEYMEGCFEGSVAFFNAKGYMNTETFLLTLEHFKTQTAASKDDQVLLILDNHVSHLSLDAIRYCRENGIHMLTLPPHTSHRTQPLDLSVFGPFKTYCATAFDNWMSVRVGNRVSLQNIARLSSEPLRKCMTRSNIQAGFVKSGIYPMNRSKLLVYFESNESPSPSVSYPVLGNDPELPLLSTTVNATAAISQGVIAPKIVSQHELIPHTSLRDEMIQETSVQDAIVQEVSRQDELVQESSEQDKVTQETWTEDDIIQESSPKALDLSVSRQISSYKVPEQHMKIFSTSLPLDLTISSNPQLSTSKLRFGGLELIKPLPSTPSSSKQSRSLASTVVTGSPELHRKEEMDRKRRMTEENKSIKKKSQEKTIAKGAKRKIAPDTDIPKRKRGRPKKLPL